MAGQEMPGHDAEIGTVVWWNGVAAASARGRPRACCASINSRQMLFALPITLWVCVVANNFPCTRAAMRPQLPASSALLHNAGTACPRGFACTPAAFATSTCCPLSTRALVCKGNTKRRSFAARPCGGVCSARMELEGGNSGGDERLTHSEQPSGKPETRDGPYDEHLPMPNVPETIFAEFRALWLKTVLRHAVHHEKYDTAGRLKGTFICLKMYIPVHFYISYRRYIKVHILYIYIASQKVHIYFINTLKYLMLEFYVNLQIKIHFFSLRFYLNLHLFLCLYV